MNISTTSRPSAIRTMCCFSLPPPGRPPKTRSSSLQEEFHLDPGKFDHVMVIQRMRLGVEGLAVYDWKAYALYVGDEKALRPTRDDGHLDAGFAERRERLGEIELLAGVRTREKLQRGIFLRRGRRLGWRNGRGRCTLTRDGVTEIFCARRSSRRHGGRHRRHSGSWGGRRGSSGPYRTGAKHYGFLEVRRLCLPRHGCVH